MLYDYDFPKTRRKLKDGTVVEYVAGTLCHNCKNRYDRDRRRERSRAEGRAIRPQDVPWKRYRDGNELVPIRQGLRLVMVQLEKERK